MKPMNEEEFKKRYNADEQTFIPTQATVSSSLDEQEYNYIAKLLISPLSDGRHRVIWLILAPYLVNVLKLNPKDAYDILEQYIQSCKKIKDTDVSNNIDYYINYARYTKLMPPKLDTIKQKFPDLYNIIINEAGKV
jgi:hypothetical protein